MGMPPVTLEIRNAYSYWAEFNGNLAERANSAANLAKGFGADVLIVIKAPQKTGQTCCSVMTGSARGRP
jgi:hypothetical protein